MKFCHRGHLEFNRLFDTADAQRRDLLQGFFVREREKERENAGNRLGLSAYTADADGADRLYTAESD